MASITTDESGSRRIQFLNADGKRLSVRIGPVSMKAAESFKSKVEAIIADLIIARPHDDEVSRWLRDLDARMVRRLARVGLSSGVGQRDTTLGHLLNEFLAALNVKPGTMITYKQTKASLIEHFGEDRLIRTIGDHDAEKWRQWMKGQGLAEATISKRVKTARQAFKKAVKWKMVSENPFLEVRAGSQKNKKRQHFITHEVSQKVIDACPDAEWRLIVALSRFGGLRCPSEHLGLTVGDVNWETRRLRVTSPKTEAHEGGAERHIPIFRELRGPLLDVWEAVPEGSPATAPLISRYRDKNCNLRTQLLRIMKRAGVKAWPRLFHNLRSSRQTELSERFPQHVVCSWLGNTEDVARDHYLQLLDSHFDAASKDEPSENCAESVQQASAHARTDKKPTPDKSKNPPVLPGDAAPCLSVQGNLVTPMGFERTHENTGKSRGSRKGCAISGALRPPADAIPDGGLDGALSRLADGSRRLMGGKGQP